jgi:hypothetical protein
MGSGMENPDLPALPIYRRLFHVPKGGGKSGFYCTTTYEFANCIINRLNNISLIAE